MNLNMQRLFDSLKDGLIIVAGDGRRVVYGNPAAHALLPLVIGKPLTGDWLLRHVSDIQNGYVQPPVSFEIDLPGESGAADEVRVTLVPSPVGSDYIALLNNLSDEAAYENVISNLAEMLDCHFRDPMQQFSSQLADVLAQLDEKADADFALRESVAELKRKGAAVREGLQQLGLLASTFKSSPMRGDDRIKVGELVAAVFTATRSLLVERRVRVSVAGLGDQLPLIYGSRNFLVQALAGYVRYLLRHIDHGVDILISVRPKGNFILLSIANFGKNAPPVRNARSLMPLLGTAGKEQSFASLDLTLPLCKRVIELNGGSLRFDKEGDEIGRITFELPVGAPVLDEQSLAMQQAQRYAEDLLALMQRQSATLPNEKDEK